MKQATVTQSFHDIKEGVFRKAGDAFLCEDERGQYLAGLGLVFLKDAPEEKRTRKKVTKK
jgi:hypothetical protein